ncbi:MAG: branched-chain amino acid transport system ATP-binding protein [Halanaerobiales bacterium]|nr:branched-chain amino acid transport system ATP-binding protein [Halanaerobiales bacterium]
MLRVENLHVHYGGIHALKGISLEVPEGKIITLIGANGAGKSTTLRTICGLVEKSDGKIFYRERDISSLDTRERTMEGLVMVPEGRRIFPNLTVYENLQLGSFMRTDEAGINKDLQWVYELFPILEERREQKAGTLSGGEQQMLAVGRALMSRPKLLLMDEPSLGLAPLLVKEIFEIIEEIKNQGTTILLIEQNAYAALNIADYAYVLETGKISMKGPGRDLLNNDEVRKAYLGG